MTSGPKVLSYFTRNVELAPDFVRKYGRPFPWFELVEFSERESLANTMSRRLGMAPLSGDLCAVCKVAGSRMRFQRPKPNQQPVDDSVEALSSIVGRCGIFRESVVYYTDRTSGIARARLRDLLAFEGLLWAADHDLLSEDGRWIIYGSHNTLAGFLDLP